jgi:hypothetical protein
MFNNVVEYYKYNNRVIDFTGIFGNISNYDLNRNNVYINIKIALDINWTIVAKNPSVNNDRCTTIDKHNNNEVNNTSLIYIVWQLTLAWHVLYGN